MNDISNTNRAEGRMPSDDQMDFLLRDFFRLEVPKELNQPLRRNPLTIAAAATLTLAPEHHFEQLRPRSVRFVGVAASVAAMSLAVLVMIFGNTALPLDGNGLAKGTVGDTRSPGTTPDIDKAMSVSRQGNSRTATMPVSPDGVTLEETDTIELHPQK